MVTKAGLTVYAYFNLFDLIIKKQTRLNILNASSSSTKSSNRLSAVKIFCNTKQLKNRWELVKVKLF
jgi:hypothetical protein